MQAVIPLTTAQGQIPVSRHPAVGTMLIVPVLCPVTLGAQRHRLSEWQRASIREFERGVTILRVMARDTGQLTMGLLQPLMKLIEVSRVGCSGIRNTDAVAGETLK